METEINFVFEYSSITLQETCNNLRLINSYFGKQIILKSKITLA